ncbi:MAG: ABC transporter ATP-binding protein [Muribaculum sp.]|nr:ABC transporter ATP-binding protein [Muribaculum sp.]
MSQAVILHEVTKRYGRLTALDRVTFDVAEGELFGLIGPDGAGKSSLYRILATLCRPDGGHASVFGRDTVADYRSLRAIIGYMPQQFSLYQDMTVGENLNFFASLFGVQVKENYDLIAPVFGRLERFSSRRAGALSGGMKQKLALSCALIHRPKILFLDEPTTGVDAMSRSEFWDMLSVLRQSGITVLVSTSYMDEATRCERIALIDKGHILGIDTPDRLVDRIGENLYSATATDMFGLLKKLRSMPVVEECYTFGASLHVVGGRDFDENRVATELRMSGFADANISRIRGDIEDLFIKLTRDGRQ